MKEEKRISNPHDKELQSTVDYTMIFRVLIYVVNNLLRFFLNTPKKERERKDFRLPSMVPIVFYNGEEEWTAERELRKYQKCGEMFGDYVLNLEYYLVNLSAIETDEILSTNTVLDNIMYCDKYRKNLELAEAIRVAYNRIQKLGNQEKEELRQRIKSQNDLSVLKEWLQEAAKVDSVETFEQFVMQ